MTLFLEDYFKSLTEDWRGFVILIGHHVKTLELELALINSGCIFILDQIYFTNRMVKFVISFTTLILLGIVLTGSENSCRIPDHLTFFFLMFQILKLLVGKSKNFPMKSPATWLRSVKLSEEKE